MRYSPIFPLLLLALAGCGEGATGPAAGVRVAVRAVLRDSSGALPVVAFAVENRGTDPAYLPRCGERIAASVEEWREGRWEAYSSGLCPAVLPAVPLALAPGGEAESAVAVHRPGRYRLRLTVGAEPAGPAARERYSDPFTIE